MMDWMEANFRRLLLQEFAHGWHKWRNNSGCPALGGVSVDAASIPRRGRIDYTDKDKMILCTLPGKRKIWVHLSRIGPYNREIQSTHKVDKRRGKGCSKPLDTSRFEPAYQEVIGLCLSVDVLWLK